MADVPPDGVADAFYSALLDDDAQALYDRAPCGYLSTTPDGTIVKVNQTFLALTGHERSALVGRKRFVELLSGGGRIYHETHYAPMLRGEGIAREIAFDLVRADGERLPVLVNAVLERAEDGTPLIARVAVFDATNRRSYERELLAERRRAEESEAKARVLAQTLQQVLIPPAPPAVPGLEVTASYRPAGAGTEVGGDFYDVFELVDGDWVVVVGDVRGKGAEAAVVTALARSTVRAAAVRHASPAAILGELDAVLARHADRFCTAVVARLRREGDRWRVALSCGGHPQPLVVRPGRAPEEVGRPGSLLGAVDDALLHDDEVVLGPGDALVAFTDGVTEGRRGRELFGDERLADALARLAAVGGPIAQALVDEVLDFQAGDPRDDVVVVALRVPAADDAWSGDDVDLRVAARARIGVRRAVLALPADATSPGTARRALREVLGDAGGERWIEPATLALSELVANAVLHARTDIEVRIEASSTSVRVEVRDGGEGVPVPVHAGTDAPTGRGMAIVAALATRCGVRRLRGGGKGVWFWLTDAADAGDPLGVGAAGG